jgi:hypothetical protein
MIARAGLYRFESGQRDTWSLNAFATQPLPSTRGAVVDAP